MKVLVTGGYGFVGPKVVHALRARDHAVRALVRDRGRAKTLESWGCELVGGRHHGRRRACARAAEGVECVVHLVAIIKGSPKSSSASWRKARAISSPPPRRRARTRFVLMSALGTSEENRELVPYYRAKWDMEQAVIACSGSST